MVMLFIRTNRDDYVRVCVATWTPTGIWYRVSYYGAQDDEPAYRHDRLIPYDMSADVAGHVLSELVRKIIHTQRNSPIVVGMEQGAINFIDYREPFGTRGARGISRFFDEFASIDDEDEWADLWTDHPRPRR